MRRLWAFLFWLLSSGTAMAGSGAIPWQPWSEDLFQRAVRENRLVLLDLEAVWCHWCHVMDKETYADPKVAGLIRERFIPVRVDQDSRPDLANRYRDYGWPATIVFNASGRELAKRAGFLPADEMLALLRSASENPDRVLPEAEALVAVDLSEGALSPELRAELRRRHLAAQDEALGGLRLNHKFLDADSVEYSLRRAQAGDAAEARRARRTLDAALALLDPVWGGIYQYSHGGVWENPHFEKILSFQRDNLRLYALAYAEWGDPRYLRAARAIRDYLKNFLLGPEGGFYTSQDADLVRGEHGAEYFSLDDGARRRLGIPRVDRNRYARENGWAIEGLVALYRASGDAEALRMAREAALWVLRHRALDRSPFAAARWLASRGTNPAGGFSHGETDAGGPYFGDSLAMGRAFLALYEATAEREWLRRATLTGRFLAATFPSPDGAGYVTAAEGGPLAPGRSVDENVAAARFWNRLSHYGGQKEFRDYARRAMRYLALPAMATDRLTEVGILLADEELSREPLHITVVGGKDEARARELFIAALAYPSDYLRIEWWDRREGPMPNPDVKYPEMPKSAAFLCGSGLCSSPIYEAADLAIRARKFAARAEKNQAAPTPEAGAARSDSVPF